MSRIALIFLVDCYITMKNFFRSLFNLRLLIYKIPFFYLILGVGVILRLLNFPDIPPGLNQDEAANGYEAYSLLTTGGDRWGNKFPVYFVGWGSGQNVLLAYLQIPFIAIFGLNSFSIRLPLVILGILSIWLTYILAKKIWNKQVALLSSGMLAILPWHVMTSRWALESNVLPFSLLLGLVLLVFGIDFSRKQNLVWWQNIVILCSLCPFAISLYGYGLSVVPISIFLILVSFLFFKDISKKPRLWLGSIGLAGILGVPFLLFFIKNNLLKANFGFEQFLPFSINLLPASRLSQINDGFVITASSNLFFLTSGFPDFLVWNNDPSFLPLAFIAFPFSLLGIYFIFQNFRQNLKKSHDYKLIPVLWLLAFVPILFLVPLNANRANSLFIPIIMISSFGILELGRNLSDQKLSKFLVSCCVIWLVFYSLIFQVNYHFLYSKVAERDFNSGYQDAITKASEIADSKEKIYLTKEVSINYVFPLFVYQTNPEDFRREANYELKNGDYNVRNWRNFYFDKEGLNLQKNETWLAILKPCKNDWCDKNNTLNDTQKCYQNQELWRDEVFVIYRCFSR